MCSLGWWWGPKISNTIDLSESSTDAGIDRRSKPVEVWKKKHFLRTITVSVDDIHQMPEVLRIRKIYEEHVLEMMTLATRNCSLNPNVRVVCLDFEGDKDSNKDLIQHGLGCVEGNHSGAMLAREVQEQCPVRNHKVELYLASAKSTEDIGPCSGSWARSRTSKPRRVGTSNRSCTTCIRSGTRSANSAAGTL